MGFHLRATRHLISAVLFTTIGLATVPVDPDFDLNLFLLQSISLVVLGYMMAHWGGAENMLKRRLALLKDISALLNPRFGIDRMLGSLIERLRTFYHADACLLVTVDPSTGQYSMRRASRHNPEVVKRSEPITEDVARLLLELPVTQAMVSTGKPYWRGWWRSDPGLFVCDALTAERITEVPKIDKVFTAESLVTVPVLHHGETIGRLYVIASQHRVFEVSDITFLLQVFEHTIPLMDNLYSGVWESRTDSRSGKRVVGATWQPHLLAMALLDVLHRPQEAKRRADKGYQWVIRHCTSSVRLRQVERIYFALCQGRKAG